MPERVLVTGAAGFIGSHCSAALVEAGYQVVGLDNFDPFYDRATKEQGIAPLLESPAFELVEGDIRNRDTVGPLMNDVDVILHLAARAGVRPSIDEPLVYTSVNIDGTVQLLDCATRAGVSRFVFGSSSSVYGDATPVPFREDAPALSPISPYAATKRAGELLCDVYVHLHKLRIASLRFFTVYGPRQRPDLAIHKFTRLLANRERIQQYGDGSTERDYTHVDDIVGGVMGAIEWTERGGAGMEIFNLGESRSISLRALVTTIANAMGVEPAIDKVPMQPGDVQRTFADISKARRDLGYDPQVTIEDGIRDFVRWYKETNGS